MTSVTMHKFAAKYGNYHEGHTASISIEGITHDGTTGELTYVVKYEDRRTLPFAYYIPASLIHIMRQWLASQPICGPVAHDWYEAQVLRRVEQYYGHNGLHEFMREAGHAARI